MKKRKSMRCLAGMLSLVMILSMTLTNVTLAADDVSVYDEVAAVSEAETEGTEPELEESTIPGEDNSTEEIVVENETSSDIPAEEYIEPVINETSEPAVVNTEEQPQEAAVTTVYNYEDAEVSVVATLSDGTAIPEGSELKVRKLAGDMPNQADKDRFNWVDQTMQSIAAEEEFVIDGSQYYDIYFLSNGQELIPGQGDMTIEITYKNDNAVERYKNSNQEGKEVKVFQMTKTKDENNEDIYKMEDLNEKKEQQELSGEEAQLRKLDVDATGNVKAIELKESENTYYPIAVIWKENPKMLYTCSDVEGEVDITATLSKAGIIPEGAELKATKIKTEDAEYEKVEELVNAKATGEKQEVHDFTAYDIRFEVDGVEVEPEGEVTVEIQFKKQSIKKSEESNISLLHISDDETVETVNANVNLNDESKVENVSFATNTFSTYVVLATGVISSNTPSLGQYGYIKFNNNIEAKSESAKGSGRYLQIKLYVDNEEGKTFLSEKYYKVKEEKFTVEELRLTEGYEFEKYAFNNVEMKTNSSNNVKFSEVKTWNDNKGKANILSIYIKTKSKPIMVKFVGDTGNEIKESVKLEDFLSATGTKTTKELAPKIEGYKFVKTIVGQTYNQNSGTTEDSLLWALRLQKTQSGSYQYNRTRLASITVNGDWKNITSNDTVFMEYKAENHILERVDSASAGIELNMFNYDKSINTESKAGDYGFSFYNGANNHVDGKGGTNAGGKVGTVLGSDGYPIAAANNKSLEFLYNQSYAMSANYLFEYNAQTQSYEYDSQQNHAYYDEAAQRFYVYDYKISPAKSNYGPFNVGNFLPYNDVLNPTQKELNFIQMGQENRTNIDYWFGMSMAMSFYQPEAGTLSTGEKMKFEFRGDDDVFVYLDGVLILDLGGIHAAQIGSIDFSTGVINQKGDTYNIYDLYKASKKFTQQELDNMFKEVSVNGKSYHIFKDYKKVEMKFFYLERGAGASNCHIKFNMPPIPKNSIIVEKKIENANADVYSDVEFSFKLETKTSENSKYTLVKNKTFDIYKDGQDTGVDSTVNADGLFTLKHGEQAVFKDYNVNTIYKVTEVGVNSQEYDHVKINGVEVEIFDNNNTQQGQIADAATGDLILKDTPKVVFSNRINTYNKKELIIKKTMADGKSLSETFKFKVYLGIEAEKEAAAPGSGTPYSGLYYKNQKKYTATDGIIEISAEDLEKATASIVDLPSKTSFKVVEVDPNEGLNVDSYESPTYEVSDADVASEKNNEAATGVIKLENNTNVLVTNSRISDDTIIKRDVDFSKTAQVTDWDKRTYEINLTAKSKVEVTGKGAADIVLLLDNSSSMNHSSFGGNKRGENLKKAVDSFIEAAAENSPNSNIALVTFDQDSTQNDILADFTEVGSGKSLKDAMKKYSLGKGTRQDLGLANVKTLLANYDGTNPRYVILFTDGEPYPENIRNKICQDAYNTAWDIKENATLYTVGLIANSGLTCTYTLKDGTVKKGVSVTEWLSTLASDKEHAIQADDTTDLVKLFTNIQQSISQNVSVKITDVLDSRFALVTGEKERLEGLGATVTENISNGTTTIVWPVTATKEGWNGTINIVAKEEYIGGNNVSTNVWNESVIEYEGRTTHLVKEEENTPTVNVKAHLLVNNNETTIFWGDTVPTQENIIKQLFDKTHPTGQLTDVDGVRKTVEYSIVEPDAFQLEWYANAQCRADDKITLDSLETIVPDPETKEYYLKVIYTGLGAPTNSSISNTDGNIAGDSSEGYQLTAHNSVEDTTRSYGVYKINIVTGELTITKKIDTQYTNINKINSNQSFIFKIERSETLNGDPVETYYEVLSFDANQTINEKTSATITGLKKGYYTVTEEESWSVKYDLYEKKDNYAGNQNGKENVNLYIGQSKDSLSLEGVSELITTDSVPEFYGLEKKYKDQGIATGEGATTKFENHIKKDWSFLSDVATAINRFTGNN